MSTHQHVATNHSTSSENRIHSDDVAQQYGYRGALVAGVQVFGHMSYPLTETLGDAWMRDADVSVRFLSPAYHGDRLEVSLARTDAGRLQVDCHNVDGTLLATLSATLEAPRPANDLARTRGPALAPERVNIDMNLIDIGEPFASEHWQSSLEENRRFADQVEDDLPLYRDGAVIHPHLVLHYANQALMARFILPAWLHVGSELHFHRPLLAGETIEIRCVPTEKWERKGHQFIKVYIAYLVDDEPAVEIEHTAIFRIAQRG
jgi:acyl dehydratase